MPEYESRRQRIRGRWNGAYYYSREIVANIAPRVVTDRAWVTVNVRGRAEDRAIVFVHNNRRPDLYGWLAKFRGLVLVCGVPDTVPNMEHLGRSVYLPLSIDVAEVERYRRRKDRGTCYVGRVSKVDGAELEDGTAIVGDMPREQLLAELARYRRAYAVGRCAIEARALGCEVLPYDPRFPDPNLWAVVDNAEAADMLQVILDRLEGQG